MKKLPLQKLGLSQGESDILNLKCDPMYSFSIINGTGIFPAWHMNKEHWISVRLDGTVPLGEIIPLINMSFALTKSKRK